MMNLPKKHEFEGQMHLRDEQKVKNQKEGLSQLQQEFSATLQNCVTDHAKPLDALQPNQALRKIVHVPTLTSLENIKRDNVDECQINLAFSLNTGVHESTLFRLGLMPKSTSMQILTQAFPHHRPKTVACSYQTLAETIECLDASEVYIKGNTAGAADVYHVILQDDGTCRVMARDYPERKIPVSALGDELKRMKGGANNSDALLAEASIDIPRTSSGSTWEIRFYSSIKKELTRLTTWMKVSRPNSSFNVYQEGAQELPFGQYETVLDDVIANCLGDVDDKETFVSSERRRFLDEAEALADGVRHRLEQEYQSVVRQSILPSDLRNPSEYEAMLQECFCTILQDVDIAGTWDEGQRRLRPMIMEVNEEFSLDDPEKTILVQGLKSIGVPYRHERLREYLTPEAAERLLCTPFEGAPPELEKDFTKCIKYAGAIHYTNPEDREMWRLEVAREMKAFFDENRDYLNAQPDIAAVIRTSFLQALVGDIETGTQEDGREIRKPIDFKNPEFQKGLAEIYEITSKDFLDQPEHLREDLCIAARTAKLNQIIPDPRISGVLLESGLLSYVESKKSSAFPG